MEHTCNVTVDVLVQMPKHMKLNEVKCARIQTHQRHLIETVIDKAVQLADGNS